MVKLIDLDRKLASSGDLIWRILEPGLTIGTSPGGLDPGSSPGPPTAADSVLSKDAGDGLYKPKCLDNESNVLNIHKEEERRLPDLTLYRFSCMLYLLKCAIRSQDSHHAAERHSLTYRWEIQVRGFVLLEETSCQMSYVQIERSLKHLPGAFVL